MSTYLLNQNIACQIEMMHISFVNLRVAEITLASLTEELAMDCMELLCSF